MKTIGDLERWVRNGEGTDINICFGPLRKVFYVESQGIKQESRTLEGALENLLEELRRKENGAESMRTEKPQANGNFLTKAVPAFTVTTPVGAFAPVNSPSFTPVQVNCPDCYEYPCNFDFDNIKWVCCCGKRWQDAITTGDVYYLTAYIGATPKKWQCTSLSAAGWVLVP